MTRPAIELVREGVCIAALLVGAVGCAPSDGSGSGPVQAWRTERVMVGDTTVVRTIDAAAAAAELQLEQELVIGRTDGSDAELFESLSHVTPLPNGDVVFFESGAVTIRRFDSSGQYINSIGRSGKGPGEFSGVYRIDFEPDGHLLVEADESLNRYTLEGVNLHDRFIQFQDPQGWGSQRTVTEDGLIHVVRIMYDQRYKDSTEANGGRLRATVAHRMELLGKPIDTVYQPTPAAKPRVFEYVSRRTGRAATRPIPTAPRQVVVYSKLGYWISGGEDGSYSFTLFRREGGPLRIESDLPRVETSDAERENLRYAMERVIHPAQPSVRPVLDDIPAEKAAFKSITTDVDGRLWVQISQPGVREDVDTLAGATSPTVIAIEPSGGGSSPGAMRKQTERYVEPIVYDVFAPDGEFLGRLRLPERSQFGNALGSKVWLIVLDDLDVPTLVRYRVSSWPDSARGSVPH